MDKYALLYVLEKVKAACRAEHSSFHTFGDSEDDQACRQLEADGLIRLSLEEAEHDHRLWTLAD